MLLSILIVVLIIIILILLRLLFIYSREFGRFAESIKYRDFSRNYKAPKGVAPPRTSPATQGFSPINSIRHRLIMIQGFNPINRMKRGFNIIQDTFRTVSTEKETQYQYLQTVLEMVDTGILAYEADSGKVMWMNDALKDLLGIPYLKTIESLQKRDPELYDRLEALQPGERSIIIVKHNQQNIRVVLSVTGFLTGGVPYRLVVFQNVHEALDETESRAWQRLLSVMTHEIMNSVAPIASLAETLQKRVKELPEAENQRMSDIELGIETIKNRSEGLLRFAEVYRNLYKVTGGKFTLVRVSEIFGNIHRLMKPKLEQLNITAEIIMIEPLLEVKMDRGLIDQVLINLMLNAIDAVKDTPEPRIRLTAYTDNDNRPIIKVADNGTGIPDENLDKIFIPFFSTKKNGNGIGLPLCKQIMQVHKGTISVQSIPNEGTVVFLRF